jgi:hypothetical protein
LDRKTLGYDIGELMRGRHVQDANFADGYFLPDEMNVDLDVLRPSVLYLIGGHVDGTDVVTVHYCGRSKRNMEFLKKLPEPTTLGHGMGNRAILSFCARARHCGLAFGGPRHNVVAEENTVA